MLVTVGGGCTKRATPTPAGGGAAPAGGKKILVWSHLTEKEVDEVRTLANTWAKQTGNTVEVIYDQSGFQEFATAATAGAAPDLMYGIAHDNLGPFWKAGLLQEVPAGSINEADYVKNSLDAVTFEGRRFGVPVSMESIGLFYNRKLVPTAPTNWNDFVTAASAKGFQYDVKNFYFSYGFLGGEGGYIFANKNGTLDPTDIGLNNAGAVRGLTLIGDFTNRFKWMPQDVNSDMAKANFQSNKIALYLSGPWDVKGFQDAGVDFGVAPMPTLDNGKPFQPFVGVQAAFVWSGSKVSAQATDLMTYLNANAPKPLFTTGNRIPVQTKFQNDPDVKANANMSAFTVSATNGTPMPNIPAMGAVWDPAAKMLDLVTTAKATPKAAADDAVKTISDAVKAQG
jgi:arabinogalactan oligomer/maltooligosaccharide transport system substrate-binding protein